MQNELFIIISYLFAFAIEMGSYCYGGVDGTACFTIYYLLFQMTTNNNQKFISHFKHNFNIRDNVDNFRRFSWL